jgi:hypothetical protein
MSVPLKVGLPLINHEAVWDNVPIDAVELKIGLPERNKKKQVTVPLNVPPLMVVNCPLLATAPSQIIEPPNTPPLLVIVPVNLPAFIMPANVSPAARYKVFTVTLEGHGVM